MVQVSVSLMEPLPPIDVDRFKKEIEAMFWEWLYAVKSPKDSQWWERASGQLWVKLTLIANRYGIALNLDMLRTFRATFLYDTLMYRLWPQLKASREYRAYIKIAGQRARRRLRKAVTRRLFAGPSGADYRQIEQTLAMGQEFLNQADLLLHAPTHRFANIISKASYTVSLLFRMLGTALTTLLLLHIAVALVNVRYGTQYTVWGLFAGLMAKPLSQLTILLGLLWFIRKSLMRLEDVDPGD
jgi:hypothetical protein